MKAFITSIIALFNGLFGKTEAAPAAPVAVAPESVPQFIPTPTAVQWQAELQDGFETILATLANDYLGQAEVLCTTWKLFGLGISNPPSPIYFTLKAGVRISLAPVATVISWGKPAEQFDVYYAVLIEDGKTHFGLYVAPQGFRHKGIFYYIMPAEEIDRARRVADIGESWNTALREAMEERIHDSAGTHHAAVARYMRAQNLWGLSPRGVAIGEAKGCISRSERWPVGERVLGNVSPNEVYPELLMTHGPWAMHVTGSTSYMYVDGWGSDYTKEASDAVVAYMRRNAAA